MTNPLRWAISLLLWGLATLAMAENSTRADGFTVHHNAIPVAMLSPEIASHYRIVRSKYRGLLNVAVIRDQAGTTGTPVTARVTATAANLAGVVRPISLREIREGEAIYYIGDFPIVNGEMLNFSLEVLPAGAQRPIRATLSQEFYID